MEIDDKELMEVEGWNQDYEQDPQEMLSFLEEWMYFQKSRHWEEDQWPELTGLPGQRGGEQLINSLRLRRRWNRPQIRRTVPQGHHRRISPLLGPDWKTEPRKPAGFLATRREAALRTGVLGDQPGDPEPLMQDHGSVSESLKEAQGAVGLQEAGQGQDSLLARTWD